MDNIVDTVVRASNAVNGYDGSIPGAPSAVDRMAALADPHGSAAKRVRQWEEDMAAITRLNDAIGKIWQLSGDR